MLQPNWFLAHVPAKGYQRLYKAAPVDYDPSRQGDVKTSPEGLSASLRAIAKAERRERARLERAAR